MAEIEIDQQKIKAAMDLMMKRMGPKFAQTIKEKQSLKGDFTALKNAAKYFIQDMGSINSNKIKQLTHQIATQGKSSSFHVEKISKLRNNWDTLLSDKKNTILTFQSAIDAFLGRSIILTAVDVESGQLYFYNEQKQSDIYKNARKGRYDLSFSSKISPDATLTELINTLKDLDEENIGHTEKVQQVYRVSYERSQEESSNKKWIYYHNLKKRNYLYIGNQGVLAQAYTSALFENARESYLLHGNVQQNIPPFYYNYILSVDRRSGSIIGDIANEITDKYQLAIKTKNNAQSQRYAILWDIAEDILKTEQNMTISDLAARFIERQTSTAAQDKRFQTGALITQKTLKKKLQEFAKNITK